MLISDFDFALPDELVAQEPLAGRADSRMLAVNRSEKTFRDDVFVNLPERLREDDVLVLNNTKVFPARLLGKMETGAKIELFLLRNIENQTWETLARPARRLKEGKKIFFGENLTAAVLEKTKEGRCVVRLDAMEDFDEVLEKVGQTPLPPYIKREAGGSDKDRERYQTVFARHKGAIAAPTAGLHFTPEILERIRKRGVAIAEITLHVGYGTFEPVRAADLSAHRVAPERCEIGAEAAEVLNRALEKKSRIVAVGTTTTRALESSVSADGEIRPGARLADLTVTPGYRFKAVGGLLTNFHLPRSSLLVLVSTFAGYDLTMNAYVHAVRSRYRFYSYGDCMLIL